MRISQFQRSKNLEAGMDSESSDSLVRVLPTGDLVFIVIIVIWMVESVLGNFSIIYIIWKHRHMLTPTNIFLANVALSDIILAGVVLPQNVHDISHASEEYYEGDLLCRVVNVAPIVCISSSVYSMAVMSYDRYITITSTNKTRKITCRSAKAISVSIWTWSFLLSVPTMYEYREYEADVPATNSTLTACGSEGRPYEFSLFNGIFLLGMSYLVPLIWVTVNYYHVIQFLIAHSDSKQVRRELTVSVEVAPIDGIILASEQPPTNGGSTYKRRSRFLVVNKNRVRIVKMLALCSFLLAISWLPYFITLLYAKATGEDDSGSYGGPIQKLRIVLSVFSTDYNKYLYAAFNQDFRYYYRRMLCGLCVRVGVLTPPDSAGVGLATTAPAAAVSTTTVERERPTLHVLAANQTNGPVVTAQ